MKKVVIFFLFVLILLPLSRALACSPFPLTIKIQCTILDDIKNVGMLCLDAECNLRIKKNLYSDPYSIATIHKWEREIGAIADDGIRFYSDPDAEEIGLIDDLCVEEIEVSLPIITDKLLDWSNSWRPYYDGDLVVEPYTPEKERILLDQSNRLLKCKYEKYEIINNWILSARTIREYCFESAGLMLSCPPGVISINPVLFSVYLAQNINSTTFVYAFSLGLLIGAFIGMIAGSIYVFVKRRKYQEHN